MNPDNVKSQIFALDGGDFNELFSKERVKLFGRKEEYERHLEFCQEIFPYVHLIEVLLRNKIDRVLKKAINTHQSSFTSKEWLFDLLSFNIPAKHHTDAITLQKIKESILKEMDKITLIPKNLKGLSSLSNIKEPNIAKIAFDALLPILGSSNNKEEIHSTLISRLNLGTWRNIIAISHRIDEHLFGRTTDDLRKYIFPNLYKNFSSNNSSFNGFFDSVCQSDISKIHNLGQKVVIFVSCFNSLRNRMFHWENLFKYDGKSRSRIKTEFIRSHKHKKGIALHFSLKADEQNIKEYLKKLLEDFNPPSR